MNGPGRQAHESHQQADQDCRWGKFDFPAREVEVGKEVEEGMAFVGWRWDGWMWRSWPLSE